MSLFDKFRMGAQKAGTQASSFVQRSSRDVATGAQGFAQTFSLPGESEKAANILASFLGTYMSPSSSRPLADSTVKADPEDPQSALNSIPRVVLQQARGKCRP